MPQERKDVPSSAKSSSEVSKWCSLLMCVVCLLKDNNACQEQIQYIVGIDSPKHPHGPTLHTLSHTLPYRHSESNFFEDMMTRYDVFGHIWSPRNKGNLRNEYNICIKLLVSRETIRELTKIKTTIHHHRQDKHELEIWENLAAGNLG